MGILEKISDIEKEIAKTQKNKGLQNAVKWVSSKHHCLVLKYFCCRMHFAFTLNHTVLVIGKLHTHFTFELPATEYHLGLLKAKLAKYRSQLLEPSKKSEKGDGFDVLKSGDARVALIGFPSVGKVCYFA